TRSSSPPCGRAPRARLDVAPQGLPAGIGLWSNGAPPRSEYRRRWVALDPLGLPTGRFLQSPRLSNATPLLAPLSGLPHSGRGSCCLTWNVHQQAGLVPCGVQTGPGLPKCEAPLHALGAAPVDGRMDELQQTEKHIVAAYERIQRLRHLIAHFRKHRRTAPLVEPAEELLALMQ